MKQRPGDQPLPTVNDEEDVQTKVIRDLHARREVGIERYGTALQPFNGRDSIRDAYEEALDLTCYLRQILEERERFEELLMEAKRLFTEEQGDIYYSDAREWNSDVRKWIRKVEKIAEVME